MSEYSPSQVEALTGMSTAMLRQHRMQGDLDVGTKQKSGRWKYSEHDVKTIFIYRAMSYAPQRAIFAKTFAEFFDFSICKLPD